MASLQSSSLDQLNQLSAADHIDSCGNCIIRRHHGLLFKFLDPAVLIHTEYTKPLNLCRIFTSSAYHCNICPLCNMIFQHFIVIHLIDTITGRNYHIGLMAAFQELEILIDCICSALIPEAVFLGNRRCEYKKSSLFSAKIPPFGRTQMLIQRSGIVLCQHCHFLNMRARHIAQRKINTSIASGNGHSCNCPLI